METIVGLDASLTHTGICILSKDGSFEASTFCPKKKGAERLNEVYDMLEKLFSEGKLSGIQMAVMEGYAYTPLHGQTCSLGELGGIIKLFLFKHNIKLLIVAPPTLKKFITGSGKGDKNMILLKAFQKWGKEFTDDHTCDAYGLARIGMEVYNIQHKEKDIKDYFQYEQEVLKLIKKQLKEKEKE